MMGRRMLLNNFYCLVQDYIMHVYISLDDEKGSCATCEFRFPEVDKEGNITGFVVCANVFYGERIIDFDKIRDCWSIGLEEFTRRYEEFEKVYNINEMITLAYERYMKLNNKDLKEKGIIVDLVKILKSN